MTALLGAGGAFRCSSEHDCSGTAPAHPDPDISMCDGDGDGSDGAETGVELLMTPAGASCEAAAEGLDRRFRDMPRGGDGAAVPLHLPDFYCDGYLPLLQLRDCVAGVDVVNEMIQSLSDATTSTAPPIAEPAAPSTLGPTATPTATPTPTPRDVLAEVDALRAEVLSLRAQMSELAEAATVPASGTRDNAAAAIALASIAILLAAAAAVVVRKHRAITATLQAQIDLQTTGGNRPHDLGMVDNPVFTRRAAAPGGAPAEVAGRGDPRDDGYLAVETGSMAPSPGTRTPRCGNNFDIDFWTISHAFPSPMSPYTRLKMCSPWRPALKAYPMLIGACNPMLCPNWGFRPTYAESYATVGPGSQSPSPSGTQGAREAGRGQQQGGVYSRLGNATYGQSQPQLSAGAHRVLTTGAGEQSGPRRGVQLQGSAYNRLGEA